MKKRKVVVTMELETAMSIKDVKEEIKTIINDMYDDIIVNQIQANVIKKDK